MKPLALALGLAGLAVALCGSYELACGFMILGIVFALQWVTTPPEEARENTQTPNDPNTQGEKL